jgi:hypothetical protein
MKKASIDLDNKQISQRWQCQLVGLSWSTYHFKPEKSQQWHENNALNEALKRQMDELQLQFPWFGVESSHHWLEESFGMSLNINRIRR